jgi:hypothetical protein
VVLCIRLASEILLGRYAPPKPRDPQSLLARHEAGVWDEARQTVAAIKGGHRGKDFNARILPLSLPLVKATGQRMAYEAARDAVARGGDDENGPPLTQQVLDLYESTCLLEDESWYVENGLLTRRQLRERQVDAVNAVLPLLEGMINDPAVDAFVSAPMVDQGRLAAFFAALPTYKGPDSGFVVRARL